MNTIYSPLTRYRRSLIPWWKGFSSQAATAKRLRISQVHYAQVESGKASCSERVKERIANLFGIYDRDATVERLERMMKRARRDFLHRRLNGGS